MYRAVKWTTLLGMQFRMHLRWEISHTEENEKIQNDLRTKASDTDLREGSSVFEQQEAPSFCSDLTHWSCFPPNRNDLPRSVCHKDKHCLAADRTREARWQTRLLQTLRKNGTGILLKWGIFSTHVADLSLEWCHFMAELSESQDGVQYGTQVQILRVTGLLTYRTVSGKSIHRVQQHRHESDQRTKWQLLRTFTWDLESILISYLFANDQEIQKKWQVLYF